MRVLLPCLLLASALTADEVPFLRGMGWSPWHATHGWNRPPEVVARDYEYLADLQVNALRTWGPAKREGMERQWREHGLYLVPQVRQISTPKMAFADGKGGHAAFALPEARAALAEQATALAKELAGGAGLAAYNLGNEYSWVGANQSGQYQSQGFDEGTLAAFRRNLEHRFGDIGAWRRLTGGGETSFAEIVPPKGSDDSLLYWEWWRFQRETFGAFLRGGHEAIRSVDPRTPVTYALLCGNRWDAATEDADLPFLELQGDNLYYHWDKNWLGYSVRLARRLGPGRPAFVTETGINTLHTPDPAEADRLMRQMLWVLFLHTDVKGVFPFVYCDEWWHGADPKAADTAEDHWGVLTADRKPKSTYRAVKETYGEWRRLEEIANRRESAVDLLVSDQALDRWRGVAGPTVAEVGRELYSRGVSFRLVSVLRPSDFAATSCRRLLLLDSTLPDAPDGGSPVRAALREFVERGGEILYLSGKPFQSLYGTAGADGIAATVRQPDQAAGIWPAIRDFVPLPSLTVAAEGEVYWREFRAGDRRFALLVAVGPEPARQVRLGGAAGLALVAGDASALVPRNGGWEITVLPTHALFELREP
ncbi:MAG: beta-galactosidase [Lentisphaeria bacterium]|jgi:hypothetical protein|nr:beta-galactosidase [Lentisphaeria bacterium]